MAVWLIRPMLATQKPDVSQLTTLVGPVAEQMQAATALTEGRRSAAFNHQKTVAEALHALTWLVYTGPGCGELLGLLRISFLRAAIVKICGGKGLVTVVDALFSAGLYPELLAVSCLPPCQHVSDLRLLRPWMR